VRPGNRNVRLHQTSYSSENLKADTISTMFQFTEDVNDVVPMTKAAAAAQAAQAAMPSKPASASTETAAPATPPTVAAPTVLSDADAEFDASMYSNNLPKLKVPTSTVARFAILGPVADGFRHYAPDSKTYYACISKRDGKRPAVVEQAECCKLWGEAKFYRSALVLHYTGADPKSGKLNANSSWQLEALVVAGAGWGQIKNVAPEGVKLGDLDYKATPRTNGFGLEFSVQANAAAWKSSPPEIQAQVMAEAERLKGQLPAKLGKVLTPLQIKAIAGQARSGGDLDALAEVLD
jgi:hypothetical protein